MCHKLSFSSNVLFGNAFNNWDSNPVYSKCTQIVRFVPLAAGWRVSSRFIQIYFAAKAISSCDESKSDSSGKKPNRFRFKSGCFPNSKTERSRRWIKQFSMPWEPFLFERHPRLKIFKCRFSSDPKWKQEKEGREVSGSHRITRSRVRLSVQVSLA